MNKLFFIIPIIAVAVFAFLSTPADDLDKNVKEFSQISEIPEDEIYSNVDTSVFGMSNLDDATYTYKIEDISQDYSFSEIFVFEEESIVNDVSQREFILERTLTFDDGSTSTETVNTKFNALDYISQSGVIKSIQNGKIGIKLVLPVDKIIEKGYGEFTVYVDDMYVTEIINGFSNVDSDLIVFEKEFTVGSLLNNKPVGTHTFNVRLNEFYLTYEDNTRLYATPDTIYSIEFEKNDSQSIIKNESGNYQKAFDFDSPIIISANSNGYQELLCLSACRGGGCCSSYSVGVVVPPPAMGSVKIKNIETGEIVAQKEAVSKGVCLQNESRLIYPFVSECKTSSSGSSLIYNAQRGQSYEIAISDPNTSFIIKIPESGGSFNYSCVEKREKISKYDISSYRSCNFPNN